MAVRVTQVQSKIGHKHEHRGTLRALGLGRIGSVGGARGLAVVARDAAQGRVPRAGRRGRDG